MTSPAFGLASAKVLLLGEHAVVYDQPALAVGIPRGVRALVAPAPAEEARAPCRLRVPAWGVDVTAATAAGDGEGVAQALRAILGALGLSGEGLRVDVEAHVPAGVGLGSSASLAVAVTRALCAWTRRDLDFATLDHVCMAAERVFHGSPSGIDHSVAAVGGVVRFKRGPVIEALTPPQPLSLVVGVAAPGASTAAQVGGVAARLGRHPQVIRPVVGAVGALVEAGVEALLRADWVALGELMDVNHGLLVALGVSTPALDAAAHVARRAGALGAKLTGAGGGGCVVALTPGEGLQAQVADALRPICQEVLCPTL
jgi:mevalonate kinase